MQLEDSYELNKETTKKLKELWQELQEEHKPQDYHAFNRAIAIAMLDYAAILAVDLSLTEDGFVAMAKQLHKIRLANAPKFG